MYICVCFVYFLSFVGRYRPCECPVSLPRILQVSLTSFRKLQTWRSLAAQRSISSLTRESRQIYKSPDYVFLLQFPIASHFVCSYIILSALLPNMLNLWSSPKAAVQNQKSIFLVTLSVFAITAFFLKKHTVFHTYNAN
jgi:hypothetical protein